MQVLIGRITADATVNKVKEEKEVVNFSIALNHSYTTKEGEKREVTTFVNCAYWRSTGIAKYLVKGSLVEVAGHISVHAYNDQQGNAKASLDFHTNEIKLYGKSQKEERAEKGNGKGKGKGGKKSAQSVTEAEAVTEPIDDLPF
jgi:single-strand DNA-binding protein